VVKIARRLTTEQERADWQARYDAFKPYVALEVATPTVREACDYAETLSSKLRKCKQVRIGAWRLGNAPRRNSEAQRFRADPAAPKPQAWTEVEQSNLIQLVPLLDEADLEERWLKVECLRNLGRFPEARRLLAACAMDAPEDAVSQIASLIDQGDGIVCRMPLVRHLHFPE